MMPDWKSDLLSREPVVNPLEAGERNALLDRVHRFECAADFWCIEAGHQTRRARRAEIIAGLLALSSAFLGLVVWYLVLKGNL